MATTARTRPTAEQRQRISHAEAKAQKALADFLHANPELKQFMEQHYREPLA